MSMKGTGLLYLYFLCQNLPVRAYEANCRPARQFSFPPQVLYYIYTGRIKENKAEIERKTPAQTKQTIDERRENRGNNRAAGGHG